MDLRSDPETLDYLMKNKEKPITSKMGEKLANEIGASSYIECSALTQKGIKKVFDDAILAALGPPKKTGCCVAL